MSGIYGIVRFDGAPVLPETLGAMREAMAYYGPDGGGQWQEGSVGLGHLLLRVTPEDSYEVQPVKKGNVTLVTYARLDNRDELLRSFDYAPADYATTPDSALVIDAYLKWGMDCPDHINGDWQFAAWDHTTRKLFIARDHLGNTGLYYFNNNNYLAFASCKKAILALHDVPRDVDMIRIAQVLTSWPGDGRRTAHEQIHRIPPAHTMLVGKTEQTLKKYWFPENLPLLYRKNDQEYVDELLHLYGNAVQSRLRSSKPIAVTLSGGLDSGSVTALAAPLLAAQGKSLIAYTSVPLYEPVGAGPNRFGDEWEFASATARMAGDNIEHIATKSENSSVLDAIRMQLQIHDEPGHAASNQYWIQDILSQARNRGVGVLLTGQCGNGTVSYAGSGQGLSLLKNGCYKEALHQLRHAEANPWLTLKRQILKPLLTPARIFYHQHIKSGGQPWLDYSAINPHFARQINLAGLMADDGHDPTLLSIHYSHMQLLILHPGKSIVGSLWHELGAAYNIEVRDPTIDRRLIEFCLQVPDRQYFSQGKKRNLIRHAMIDRMPAEVIFNTRIGAQSADVAFRVQAEYQPFSSVLVEIEKNEVAKTCLDVAKIMTILYDKNDKKSLLHSSVCGMVLTRGTGVGLHFIR
ncbi:MAG: asparagine synthase-related protein [Desulfuromonadaceae bacterium]|nr:asparagine synthase-related protein [Desulfuromonadaceae bacterium]